MGKEQRRIHDPRPIDVQVVSAVNILLDAKKTPGIAGLHHETV